MIPYDAARRFAGGVAPSRRLDELPEKYGARVLRAQFSIPVDYDVAFCSGILEPSNPLLARTLAQREPARVHRAIVVIDGGVAHARPDLESELAAYARANPTMRIEACLVVPGGEVCKTDPNIAGRVVEAIEAERIDRQSYVIAVGGGAVLDMAGYAAAISHRGVRLVRIPTTVLSQADSSVGVKNGINALGKKNFLGTFSPPFAVIIDDEFLRTLERRDTIAGMAEAVKVALLRDRGFYQWIVRNAGPLAALEHDVVRRLVRRCAELHLAHITTAGDPFELGSSRPLDFGHWAAHKLESMTRHSLRHGEAVAIGMALDTLYATDAGIADRGFATELIDLLEAIGFRVWDDALDACDEGGAPLVLAGLQEFREHLGGELTIPLVREPGAVVDVTEMDEDRIAAAIEVLRRRGG